MTRSQIVALLLGGSIAAVGTVLAWRGLLPNLGPAPSNTPAVVQNLGAPPSPAKPAPQNAQEAGNTPQTMPVPLGPPPPASPAVAASPDIPVFDTVRVEPSGDAVVAGHGAFDAKIELVSGDAVIAAVTSDGAGNFVIIPPPLAPGNYLLELRSIGKDGSAIESQQNIVVSVPPKGQKNVVVALAEPGKPSVILADTAKPPASQATPLTASPPAPVASAAAPSPLPGAPPQQALLTPPAAAQSPALPPSPPPPDVSFKTVEVDNGGFYASGGATPGAYLRIYLNGTFLADVTAGADGHWSLTVEKGMASGRFAVRADLIDDNGKVLARAEVPFDVPANLVAANAVPAKSAKPADAAAPAPSPAPQVAMVPLAPQAAAAPAPAPSIISPAHMAGIAKDAPQPPAATAASAGAPPKPKQVASTGSPQPPADAVVASIETATVVRGDSLWRISRKVFGQGIRYTLIYEANADQIRDPSLIYPGQVFVLPRDTN